MSEKELPKLPPSETEADKTQKRLLMVGERPISDVRKSFNEFFYGSAFPLTAESLFDPHVREDLLPNAQSKLFELYNRSKLNRFADIEDFDVPRGIQIFIGVLYNQIVQAKKIDVPLITNNLTDDFILSKQILESGSNFLLSELAKLNTDKLQKTTLLDLADAYLLKEEQKRLAQKQRRAPK